MIFTGAIINGILVILGGAIGLLFKKGLPQRFEEILAAAQGLAVIYVGLSGSVKGDNAIIVVISLALGAVLGELINFDALLSRFGDYIQKHLSKGGKSNFSLGFVNCTLVICIGAMAIVGSIESATMGKHDILITKSLMDMIIALIMASTMGAGVLLSGVVVFAYEALLCLCAGLISPYLTSDMTLALTCVGSILILAIGTNLLKITKIKVANLILAPFIAAALTVFIK